MDKKLKKVYKGGFSLETLHQSSTWDAIKSKFWEYFEVVFLMIWVLQARVQLDFITPITFVGWGCYLAFVKKEYSERVMKNVAIAGVLAFTYAACVAYPDLTFSWSTPGGRVAAFIAAVGLVKFTLLMCRRNLSKSK